jgi:uncharacterized protein YkwD
MRLKRFKLHKQNINYRLVSNWTIFFLFFLITVIGYDDYSFSLSKDYKRQLVKAIITPTQIPTPTLILKETPIPTQITPVYANNNIQIPTPTPTSTWGVASQVGEHTYTMKVGTDERMATPQEILDALNAYRAKNGSGPLSWHQGLASYAQERANYFNSTGTLDNHAGFNQFASNPDNIRQGDSNFHGIGENSGIGFKLLGVHLIEWVFSSDEGHNKNQLNPSWTHVGIGVSGTAVDFIFGG